MAGEYVFNLQRLTKQHDKRTVLDDITLAFFFGAHIGVIGSNGAGKSTLLRIMAGLDTEFMGECLIAKNARIGYLPAQHVPGVRLLAQRGQVAHHRLGRLRVGPDVRAGGLLLEPGNLRFFAG